MSKKVIGILGGMGPLATADLFQKITLHTVAACDQAHPRVCIDSNTDIADRTAALLHGGEDPVPEMIKSAKRLESIGADFLIMPCNTAHNYYEQVCEAVTIPVLHMIALTRDALKARGVIFAAASTIIAVFENIISFAMDLTGCSRGKAVAVNLVVIILLSLPCVFGFNLLSGFQPLGAGSTILDLEDFIVSNNLLPLGSLVYLLFCTSRYGWGWKNFRKEANAGTGIKFPKWSRIYVSYILPLIVLFIFVQGYWSKFFG